MIDLNKHNPDQLGKYKLLCFRGGAPWWERNYETAKDVDEAIKEFLTIGLPTAAYGGLSQQAYARLRFAIEGGEYMLILASPHATEGEIATTVCVGDTWKNSAKHVKVIDLLERLDYYDKYKEEQDRKYTAIKQSMERDVANMDGATLKKLRQDYGLEE